MRNLWMASLVIFRRQTTTSVLLVTGLGVLAFMLYIILAGFAHDIQKQTGSP